MQRQNHAGLRLPCTSRWSGTQSTLNEKPDISLANKTGHLDKLTTASQIPTPDTPLNLMSAQNDNVLFAQSRNSPIDTIQAGEVQEGQLLMQAERDRLVALKKAKKKLITQKQAPAE